MARLRPFFPKSMASLGSTIGNRNGLRWRDAPFLRMIEGLAAADAEPKPSSSMRPTQISPFFR
jgi:hypothetical protein